MPLLSSALNHASEINELEIFTNLVEVPEVTSAMLEKPLRNAVEGGFSNIVQKILSLTKEKRPSQQVIGSNLFSVTSHHYLPSMIPLLLSNPEVCPLKFATSTYETAKFMLDNPDPYCPDKNKTLYQAYVTALTPYL